MGTGLPGLLIKMGIAAGRTPVKIARPAARADLILAVTHVKPHFFTGYGGGAKSVVPGVASMGAIAANHLKMRHPSARLGNVEENICRRNLEEAARLGPPVFSVNVVTNARKEPVFINAGDMIASHRAAAEQAGRISRKL
jgi:nickel-dependent lactate racemase